MKEPINPTSKTVEALRKNAESLKSNFGALLRFDRLFSEGRPPCWPKFNLNLEPTEQKQNSLHPVEEILALTLSRNCDICTLASEAVLCSHAVR
jgi:hypothetical protein